MLTINRSTGTGNVVNFISILLKHVKNEGKKQNQRVLLLIPGDIK